MAEGCGWAKTYRAGFLFFAKQPWHLVMFDQASYIWYFQFLQILPPVFFTKCTMSMIWYFSSSGNLIDYNRKSHFHINKLWKAKGVSISFYGQHYTFLVIDNWFLIPPLSWAQLNPYRNDLQLLNQSIFGGLIGSSQTFQLFSFVLKWVHSLVHS